MDSIVTILLRAKDEASKTIEAVKGSLVGLGALDVFKGNLLSTGFIAALGVAQGQAQNLLNTVGQASEQQIQSLAQAGDIATQLGVGFSKAKDIVKDTRSEIAKIASDLPGTTSAYTGIFGQISATVAGVNKGNAEGFKKTALELTKQFGALGAIRQANPENSGSALNRALAGTMGFGELRQIDLFQKNPLLLKYIEEQTKSIGSTTANWQQLSTEARTKILLNASKLALTEDTLSSFNGTVSSMIEGFKTSLFDQDVGLFGFLRNVKTEGNRTGLDAVQGFLTNFFGIFKTLNSRGLSIDPMVGIIRTIDFFADLSRVVNQAIDITSLNGITTFLLNANKQLISLTNNILGKVNLAVAAIDAKALGENIGRFLGKGFGDIITNLDWKGILVLVVNIGKQAIIAGASVLKGAINGLFDSLAESVKSSFGRGVVSALGVNPDSVTGKSVLDTAGNITKGINSVAKAAIRLTPGIGTIFKLPTDLNPQKVPVTPGLPQPLVQPTTTNNKETKQSFNPVINVNGVNREPQEVASLVMEQINSLYMQSRNAALT